MLARALSCCCCCCCLPVTSVCTLPPQVAYLERRILAAEAAAEAALGQEAHPAGVAVQQESLFVGRICCDAEGGRLNPQSLLLEGSQKTSGGQRVRLDVSKLPAFRLFPGQVVALRGTNPSGLCIVATQLLPGFASPLPRSSLPDLAAAAAVAGGGRAASIVVAAGPFTSAEDLEYAPLGALLDYCAQPAHRPDLLLLLGPFVDAEHPLLRGGLAEESFEELYASRVGGWGGLGCGVVQWAVVKVCGVAEMGSELRVCISWQHTWQLGRIELHWQAVPACLPFRGISPCCALQPSAQQPLLAALHFCPSSLTPLPAPTSQVLGQLRRYSAAVGGRTRVLLVPSTRDAHHHPVLPQPPLDGAEAAALGGAGTLALANPATLRCGEVVLGCTSADWLMACNREDCSRCPPGQAEERLPALAAHLAAQRCYFPLFPPPADVPLDCSRAGAALAMPASPDLLVLPSDLAPFAKLCPVHELGGSGGEAAAAAGGSTVCINPGRLTKGASGTWAGVLGCWGGWCWLHCPVQLC